MLDSLIVKGFKLFDELRVPELSRLNLFVGRNNAGKSCLLEAVRLFTTNGSPIVIRDLVRARDGDWEANISRRGDADEELAARIENPVRFLFHDFHCQGDPNAEIQIGPSDEERRLRLGLSFYRVVRSEEGAPRRVRVEDPSSEPTEDSDEMLEVSIGAERKRLIRIETLWSRRAFPTRSFYGGDEPPSAPIVTVGTSGISAEEIGFLWDQVSLTPQQDKILDCLRLIDRRIEALALVGDSLRNGERERTPVIRISGNKERFPLRTMGDGLTRLFHIALSMVNAQDGVVLIDEFENGLYWEVQDELWPLVFDMAHEFNVQVFATSHSNDCIRSFESAWSNRPALGSMYRLERSGSSATAFALPVKNLSDALASQVEVR